MEVIVLALTKKLEINLVYDLLEKNGRSGGI